MGGPVNPHRLPLKLQVHTPPNSAQPTPRQVAATWWQASGASSTRRDTTLLGRFLRLPTRKRGYTPKFAKVALVSYHPPMQVLFETIVNYHYHSEALAKPTPTHYFRNTHNDLRTTSTVSQIAQPLNATIWLVAI